MNSLSTLLIAGVVAVLPFQAIAMPFKVDPAHSQVMFKVRHLGISSVTGRFDQFEGKIDLTRRRSPPRKSKRR